MKDLLKVLAFSGLVGILAGCAVHFGVLHEGPKTQPVKKVRLQPEIRAALSKADRVEIFVGGVHVGTVILDGVGGVFVGADPTQASTVLNELLRMMHMVTKYQREQDPDHF